MLGPWIRRVQRQDFSVRGGLAGGEADGCLCAGAVCQLWLRCPLPGANLGCLRGGDPMEGQTDSRPHGWGEAAQAVMLMDAGGTRGGGRCLLHVSAPQGQLHHLRFAAVLVLGERHGSLPCWAAWLFV